MADVAGQGDGSVAIWEWGHVGVVSQPRTPGTYAKVNRLRFNSQGNKFGAADGDGHVALWTLRLGGGSAPHRPFFVRNHLISIALCISIELFVSKVKYIILFSHTNATVKAPQTLCFWARQVF